MRTRMLRQRLMRIRDIAHLLMLELATPSLWPWHKRIGFWRRGFLSSSALIYGWRSLDDSRRYISDYWRQVRGRWVNSDNRLLNHKLATHFMLNSLFGDVMPRLYAVISRGTIVPIDCPEVDATEWLRGYLETGRSLIVKPVVGMKGHGVRLVRSEQDLNSLRDRAGDSLVYEAVVQGDYAAGIFPGAANTIRLVTMVDASGPFLAAAVHRFGCKESAPVDNWSSGGFAANVDMTSGTLGRAVRHPRFTDWKMEWVARHPDTGAMIEGKSVPCWRSLVDSVLSMAYKLRFVPYLAWDIVVTRAGFRVIEINGNTDVDLIQVHKPLLTDQRVQAFYQEHGLGR